MVATTKTVVGNVNNLSAAGLGVTTMLFDLDPEWVIVGNDIIVGVQSGGVKGEPVTPDPSTGAFSVALVAVDNPAFTITVTISGTGVETPILISIVPPPAAGSGSVNFSDLIVSQSSTNPVVVINPGAGAVTSVNGHSGAVSLTYSDVGALPSSYTPTFPVTSVNAKTGAAVLNAADVGALTQTVADGRYIADADGSKVLILGSAQLNIYRNETAGTYAGRTAVTAATTRPVWWIGSVAPLIGSGFAIDNLDFWVKTP